MAKKELTIEIGETLYDAISVAAHNITGLKKFEIRVDINAKGANIPDKIEIDISEELKGYVHEILHLIKNHLKGKEKSIKEINELKEN